MIDRFVGPILGNEDELRTRFIEESKGLVELHRDRYSPDVLAAVDWSSPPLSLITTIRRALFPSEPFDESSLSSDPEEALRDAIFFLHAMDWEFEIELRLCGLLAATQNAKFVGLRFLIALHTKFPVLPGEMHPQVEEMLATLLSPNQSTPAKIRQAIAEANALIEQMTLEEKDRAAYAASVARFEDGVIQVCHKALPTIVMEMLDRLTAEAILGRLHVIGDLAEWEVVNQNIVSDAVLKIAGVGIKNTKRRIGMPGPGGKREKPNSWSNANKRAFYERVSELEPIWTEARKDIVKMDFDHRQIEVYRTRTELKSVPMALWNGAIKTWKGDAEGTRAARDKSTTLKYVYEHAICLLELPKRSFETMKKYAGQGKRLHISKKET